MKKSQLIVSFLSNVHTSSRCSPVRDHIIEVSHIMALGGMIESSSDKIHAPDISPANFKGKISVF